MNKLVSVVIPTYNGSKTIERAIKSVYSQEYKNIEILVVIDPATNDNTREVLQKNKNQNLYILDGKKERAASHLRNIGIKESQGEYISFLDDDDAWEPSKISKQVEFLEKNLKYSSVICKYSFITNNKEIEYNSQSNDYTRDILLMKVKIAAGSNLMVRRENIFKINLFDDRFEGHQDLEIAIRLDQNGGIGHIDENLVKIFGRSGRVASNALKLQRVKNMFLDVFKNIIENFPNEIKNEVYARQWLQVSRAYALEHNRKELVKYLRLSLSYKFLFSNKFKILPFETYFLITYHYLISFFTNKVV